MKTRSKLAAMLGAGALVLGVAGMAMAAAPGNPWQGNGYPSDSCNADTTGTMLWIFNNGGTPTDLTINGELQSGSWVSEGGGSYHFTATIDSTNYPPVTAVANYTGDNGQLVLSGCNESSSSSTSTQESSTTSTDESSTTSTVESTTTEQSSTASTEESTTTAHTLPPTSTFGDTSGPGNGSWMLIAALGMLLGSALVLAPVRAKTRK